MIRWAATLHGSMVLKGCCIGIALCAGVCLPAGCGSSHVPIDAANGLPPAAIHHSPPVEQSKYRELTRELGVISIGHESAERFEIRNDSELPWTLKTIHVNCSCTTTRQTASVFLPNQSESIYVRYKAGSRSSDEHRSVVVEFKEPNAPLIKLSIRAQVRKLMTAEPNELVVSPVANVMSTVEDNVHLYNFGPSRWQAIDARASADWLTVSVREPANGVETPEAGEPSQIWSVHVVADATGLATGPYSGIIHFSCREDSNCQESLSVQMNVGSPVHVIPSSLFFGECPRGSTRTQSVRVICHPAFAHLDMKASKIRSTLPNGLHITWERASDRVWILNADLRVDQASRELIDEVVEVTLTDDRLESLQIPVRAILSRRSACETAAPSWN